MLTFIQLLDFRSRLIQNFFDLECCYFCLMNLLFLFPRYSLSSVMERLPCMGASLMALWVSVLSNWSPLTIPVSLQSAQLKCLSLRVTFSSFVLLPLCFFRYSYPFSIQQTLLILLSDQAFEKQKLEITDIYLDSSM